MIDELCEELGCSRPVVREALRVLSSMGMVESRRRLGTVVQPLDNWNLFDPAVIRWRLTGPDRSAQLTSLIQLRSAVEPEAAFLAAGRDNPADELMALAERMWQAANDQDHPTFLEADIHFHRELLHLSGNPMFAQVHSLVHELLAGRYEYSLMPPTIDRVALGMHRDLARAVQGNDAEQAHHLMRQIVTRAAEEMLELNGR